MKKYSCILFDLDGTLTYSHPGIFGCIRYALMKMGRGEPEMEKLRLCIGPSLEYSYQNYFGMSEQDAIKATALYRERYSVVGWKENAPIGGALDLLKDLKNAGYTTALATSKPLIYSEQITKLFGFSPYLDVEVGPGLDGSLPTKASVIAEVLKRLGASAEECLMIGDREHDAEGAKENGVDCALLKIGYAENEGEFERAKPRYVFEGYSDLREFLLQEK